ncbi:MAG: hypothetical protein K8F24_07185, partial [Bacteroidales bacterium]|nr:hypothetical protein [Bacteroidales bacterium]
GVKTLNVTEKTGNLISIKDVTDSDDLMIINKSGLTIRIAVASLRVMGRATQGVRLINLKEDDEIAAVAKVTAEDEEAIEVEILDENGDPIGTESLEIDEETSESTDIQSTDENEEAPESTDNQSTEEDEDTPESTDNQSDDEDEEAPKPTDS